MAVDKAAALLAMLANSLLGATAQPQRTCADEVPSFHTAWIVSRMGPWPAGALPLCITFKSAGSPLCAAQGVRGACWMRGSGAPPLLPGARQPTYESNAQRARGNNRGSPQLAARRVDPLIVFNAPVILRAGQASVQRSAQLAVGLQQRLCRSAFVKVVLRDVQGVHGGCGVAVVS